MANTLGERQIEEIKAQASSSLNSQALQDQPSIDYQTYQEPLVDDISRFQLPDLQMTGSEQQVQGFSDQLQALNQQLLGESAYRAEREDTKGLPGLLQTQTDLTNRIRTLQAEQQAIPLQIQQESEGRGRTRAGTSVLEMGRLRENAIQALSTNALLQATNGNILTAQTLVDRAVAQKFDPVRERINVAKANIELILNSPKFSIEDKNRAQKQMAIQAQKEKELETQEAEEKAIMGVALQAAQAGLDAVTQDKIKNAGSQLEATQIAQAAGLFTMEENEQMRTKMALEGFKLLKPSQLDGLTEDDILRLPNGDIYKKPSAKKNTQVIAGGGNTLLIDTDTGEVIANFGSAYKTMGGGGGGGGGAGGFNWDSLFSGASTEVMGFDEFADDWMKKNQMSIDPALLQEEYNNYVAQNQSATDNQVMGLSPSQVALMQGAGLTDIQLANAAGIFNGSRPPLTGIGANSKEGQAVTAGLALMGYDMSKASQDWDAMKKRLSSMNSTQQLKLSQSIYALEGSTHQAEKLYSEWVKTGLPKGYSSYNKAALVASANLPGQAGVAARTLVSHVEDMANELSVVYRGGNTPTDQSLQSARLSLSADWNPEQFKRNLALIRENMRIRQNSIANSGYIEGNIYNRSEPVANNQFFGSIGLDMGGMNNQDFFNLIK